MKYPIIISFLFVACTGLGNKKLSPDSEERFRLWKSDTSGCLGNRNSETAKQIIAYVDSLSNKKKIDILDLLGKPSFKYEDSYTTQFRYYIDYPCDSSKRKEVDICYLEISQNKSYCSASIVCQ